MPTIDARTGKLISGVAEAFQTIEIALATQKGTRIMRRYFGAERVVFVDRGIHKGNLIDFYAEIAEVFKLEPRLRMTVVKLSTDSDPANGHALFDTEAVYYPRGHLGDFSTAVTLKGSFTWADPGPIMV